jgi:hypothetical protein
MKEEMTIEHIKESISYIQDRINDDEKAHLAEDELREAFIRYIAEGGKEQLAEKARLVLSTNEFDFERWYA